MSIAQIQDQRAALGTVVEEQSNDLFFEEEIDLFQARDSRIPGTTDCEGTESSDTI